MAVASEVSLAVVATVAAANVLSAMVVGCTRTTVLVIVVVKRDVVALSATAPLVARRKARNAIALAFITRLGIGVLALVERVKLCATAQLKQESKYKRDEVGATTVV